MTLLNAALLYGAFAVAVPIVLHLIMRRKPTLLEFPALRFIQKRHDLNQRRLRLRHLLLLLLRAAAIALLAFALARPSVKFASHLGSQEAPVAAALIFDAAPHMQYRHDKKTRLEAAQEFGQWLLTQLPQESQIAVFDSLTVPLSFDVDRGVSKQRIERLEIVPNPRSLSSIAARAAELLAKKSDLPVKEMYVFTDLARASWRTDEMARLQQRLHDLSGVSLYVIDVGVTEPANFALGDLRLSHQVIAAGGSVQIETDVSCMGPGRQLVIELEQLGNGEQEQYGRPVKTSPPRKVIPQIKNLLPGEPQTVDFRLTLREPGLQQGVVRIVGQDALAADDVRYFSVEVRPPWPLLVVAPDPPAESAMRFSYALATPEERARHEARFDCTVIGYGDFPAQNFEKYAAICLLDPPGQDDLVWQRLTDYASRGHGVGIFLGRNATAIDSFNSAAAQQLLPGKVRDEVPREEGNTYLALQNYQHPILKDFAPFATRSPWSRIPVYRYWRIDPLAPDASKVISYNDGRPALLERTIRLGQAAGHVLMMSTPFSDNATSRHAWNVLPAPPQAEQWPFVILVNKIADYLVGSGEQQLNYFAGTASVTLAIASPTQQRYVLTRPNGDSATLPPTEKGELSISSVEQPGNYQVHSVGEHEPDRGFSVNYSSQVTQLARLTDQELGEMFGPFKPKVARSTEQIVRDVHDSRVGREIYSWLILVVAAVLAIEYVMSNWFYKKESLTLSTERT
jgi:hypothetical protein